MNNELPSIKYINRFYLKLYHSLIYFLFIHYDILLWPDKVIQFFKWKIGHINIQSRSDDFRMHLNLNPCKIANHDIICMYEVWFASNFIAHLEYNFYWTGLNEKRKYGAEIAMCKSLDIVTDNILHQSICWLPI